MRVDVFAFAPEAFDWFANRHPAKEAVEGGALDLRVHSFRDLTPLNHMQVDDTPYGGGPGMVIRVDVVAACLEGVFDVPAEQVRRDREVVVLAAGGEPFDDARAEELGRSGRDVVLLCGRFEGFDQRVVELLATREISVGPYVLAGGEVAALAVLEAVVRKMPGVLGNPHSTGEESFSPGLEGGAEYPQYTRPREFRGAAVPDVLLSGDHGRISKWRRERARPTRWGFQARDRLQSEPE